MTTKDTRIAQLRDALRHIANASCDADYDAAPAWATAALHEDDQLAAAASDEAAGGARPWRPGNRDVIFDEVFARQPDFSALAAGVCATPAASLPLAGISLKLPEPEPISDEDRDAILNSGGITSMAGLRPQRTKAAAPYIDSIKVDVVAARTPGSKTAVEPPLLSELHQIKQGTSALTPHEERALHEARAFCKRSEEGRERLSRHLDKEGEDVLREGWGDWTTAAEVLRHTPTLLKLAEVAAAYRQGHAAPHVDKLDVLVQTLAATTGRALKLPDAIDYAAAALRDLGRLADEYHPEPAASGAIDSTTVVDRAIGASRELRGRKQQVQAYATELSRLRDAYLLPEEENITYDKAVDRAIAVCSELRDRKRQLRAYENDLSRLSEAYQIFGLEKMVDRAIEALQNERSAAECIHNAKARAASLGEELDRLAAAYRRPEDPPLLSAATVVSRAIALQQHYQRKTLEQPQPPAARIVADFFEKVTADELAALFERFDWQDRAMAAVYEMLRALSAHAYPDPPAT